MTQNEMIVAIYDGMQDLKTDMRELKDRVQVLEEDVSVLKEDVSGIHLTLENVTNRNIRVVAEGHLDLSRKLDEALKADTERELMHLRVNVLENDMRRVKEKVGIA